MPDEAVETCAKCDSGVHYQLNLSISQGFTQGSFYEYVSISEKLLIYVAE